LAAATLDEYIYKSTTTKKYNFQAEFIGGGEK
jgi:hypothetical protein